MEGDFFMKAKRISAWIIAVSLCITNSGLVYAAENTGMEESTIQAVQEEDSIKEKKDEEPAAECVSEDVQAEISNENELSREITTETENVAENGTQEQHDWEGKLYSDGTAEITKYTGSDKDVVIPSTIEGHTVTSLEQEVFYDNTTVESIHIPATVIHIGHTGDVFVLTFDGATSLKSITVEEGNPVYFSREGVLLMYSGVDNSPRILCYPENRPGDTYVIPRDVRRIAGNAFYISKNLKKIVIPETVNFLGPDVFSGLSDTKIVFCHTDPLQINAEANNYIKGIFTSLKNCKIIVKNQAMKDAIGSTDDFYNSKNTSVVLESELSSEERNAYLTPATDLTFADGTRTQNIALEPEESCTIDYHLLPADTTDVVTWKSSDDSIAKVECVNGKVTVTGEANGECVITGIVHDQYTVNLNVKVKRAVTRIDIVYDGQVSPERIVSDTKDISPYPELRIYPYDAPYRENVTWESSNPSVISVEKSSYIEGAGNKYYSHQAYMHVHGPGEVTITAKYTDKETKQVVSRSIQLKLTRSIEENSVSSSDCGYNGASDANECQYTYNGSQIKPKINVTDLKYDTVLKEGTDYTVSYKNNVNPGIGEAIVKGIGNYTGKVVYKFTILKTSIRKATVKTETCQYNGKAQEPSVTVTLNGKTLKKGTDYTLSYNNNINPGTGEIIIKGKGGYTGKTVAYFEIQKKNSTTDSGKKTEKSGQKITGISSSYKKAYNSSFTLKPKAKGKITYKSSNTKVATVNSKGKVKIKGTGKVTITITAKETSAYKKQTKKVTIYAVPGKRDIKKLSSGKKKLTVQWKKDNRSDGYQVQYSTDKKFKKNVKSVVIGKKQTTKQTIKKLKTGKKYYVRIRSYKKISGKKYYGTWSSKKTVKVK